MPRISALTALASADSGDTLPILDVSATTTKKITKTAFLSDIIDGTLLATGSIVPGKIDIEVADATALAALTEVKGMIAYQADTDMLQVYDGTDWCNIPRLLKKTTLGSAGDTITVTGIPARDELEVRGHIIASGALDWGFRFNNDSGGNYAINISTNFAAPSLTYSWTNLFCGAAGAVSHKVNLKVLNPASRVKLVTGITHVDAGSVLPTNVGDVTQMGGKWCNTSAQINRVDFFNLGAGDFAIGSYVEIWG